MQEANAKISEQGARKVRRLIKGTKPWVVEHWLLQSRIVLFDPPSFSTSPRTPPHSRSILSFCLVCRPFSPFPPS